MSFSCPYGKGLCPHHEHLMDLVEGRQGRKERDNGRKPILFLSKQFGSESF